MPTVAPDLAGRVQKLEAEIGLMRVLLAQMKADLDGVKGKQQRRASDVA